MGKCCSRPHLIMDAGATARRAALSGVTIRRAKSVALLIAFQATMWEGGALTFIMTPIPGSDQRGIRGIPMFGCMERSASGFLTATFSFKVVTTGRSGTPSILARHSTGCHGLPYEGSFLVV